MLARDPAVPRRDALLDGAAVARALGVAGCERTYAKYRVGESLRVVHRTAGGVHVAGRSFADPAGAHARAAGPGVRRADALGALLWTFPADRRIAALPLIAAPGPALDDLAGARCAATRLVAYGAERSATAACHSPGGGVVAYVKVHAGDGAPREVAATTAVAAQLDPDDPRLRVPAVLGAGDAALALEPLPGVRLDALPADRREYGLERLGAALAALHGLRPPARRFGRLAPDRLARAVGAIATARPAAGPAAAAVLAGLLARRADAGGPDVCLHGDANPRNALLDGDRVALIDLEDVAAGPAAADLGHVLAGLLCARATGALDPLAERRLARALLRGYAAVGPPPAGAALAWHTAASVLARRALAAVNRVREPDLRALVPHLRAAEGLLR